MVDSAGVTLLVFVAIDSLLVTVSVDSFAGMDSLVSVLVVITGEKALDRGSSSVDCVGVLGSLVSTRPSFLSSAASVLATGGVVWKRKSKLLVQTEVSEINYKWRHFRTATGAYLKFQIQVKIKDSFLIYSTHFFTSANHYFSRLEYSSHCWHNGTFYPNPIV